MKVLNFGSLNLDYVYSVEHIAEPGETLSSRGREVFCGGKGLNQSIALAKAGAEVYHAGLIGPEGGMLIEAAKDAGVDVRYTKTISTPTGHAIIQVNSEGQNSIILFGGANQCVTEDFADRVLEGFQPGDLILLQNEISCLDYIIDKAHSAGITVILNPSPFNDALEGCDMSKVDMFFVNEIEGFQLTGEKEPERILDAFASKFPKAEVILTLGGDGAWYGGPSGERVYQECTKVEVVDTTAAGDTFTGYFISSMLKGISRKEGLAIASKAAAVAVSRKGAAPSIPVWNEIIE